MPYRKQQSPYQFDLSGGALCLDFANTVSRRHLPERRAEHLESYGDLVAFAQQSDLLPAGLARRLRGQAKLKPREAQSVFGKAIALRETLFRAFSAIAAGKPVPPEELQGINHSALEALRHRRLVRTNGDYRWEWGWDSASVLLRILWPIAESAANLLVSPDRAAVHECGASDCEWLFLDKSRNRSRRWCEMKSCGNRQKARRHYQRMHT